MKTLYLLTITAWAVLFAFLSMTIPVQAQEWKSIAVNAPPTSLTQSGQNFNIQYSVVNGTGVLQENHYMFTANVQADTSGTFEMKIPRNFPYYNGKDGPSDVEAYVVIENGIQLKPEEYLENKSDCFFTYSVPFHMNSAITVMSMDELMFMTPIYGDRVASDCTSGTMVPSQASVIKALCSQSFDHGPTFGETIGKQQCENPQSQIIYKGANLTVTNIMGKNMFKAGENMTVIPELTNAANRNVTIGYCGPLFVTLVVDQYGKLVSPQYSWACPLVGYSMNVAPNSSTPGESYGQNIMLHTPGNYTIMSIASFGDASKQIILWSKPLQIAIMQENSTQNMPPIEITQVELDSPFAFFPDNQTCSSEYGFDPQHSCLTNLIPGKKVQCAYFIGSSTCEPIHQYTGGTSHACLDFNEVPKAPQWFDMYNTQNKTVQVQVFSVQTLQNMKSWGYESYVPIPITLGPHEKCTYGFGPVDEPLALDQTNMSFAVTYAYGGKNYTATTLPMTDTYNDTLTWQFNGEKWILSQQNTVKVPEFPFTVPILLVGIVSAIAFYGVKFRK